MSEYRRGDLLEVHEADWHGRLKDIDHPLVSTRHLDFLETALVVQAKKRKDIPLILLNRTTMMVLHYLPPVAEEFRKKEY